MNIRILHAIQELGRGGAESVVKQLTMGALRAGFDVAVAAASGPLEAEFPVPRFELPIVARSPFKVLRAARALRGAISAWHPDIIHCHNPGMALAAALATRRRRNPRRLATMQGFDDRDYPAAANLLRWSKSATVACGPGVAALLRAQRVEARMIANGCTPPPPALDRGALEGEFPALRRRTLIVGVGRLTRVKNFRTSIRAMQFLPDAVLLLAGEGPERAALIEEARRLGVEDRVFLVGYRRDARALIAAADVFVITSVWEGLPLVGVEAMAAGTPLVAAQARWQQDFLHDGDNCLLVPLDDAQKMAAAISRLASDRPFAKRIARSAMETSATCSAKSMVETYLDLYRTLASAPE